MARRFRSALVSAVVLTAAVATMSSRPVSATAYVEGFDAIFEQAMIDRGYDSGAVDGKLPLANIQTITTLDLSNVQFTRMGSNQNGMASFTSLRSLNISGNTAITDLDDISWPSSLRVLIISGMTELTTLR